MRDPVGYRCNDTTHWRTGTKYKASLVTALPVLSWRSVIAESKHSCAKAKRRAEHEAPTLQLLCLWCYIPAYHAHCASVLLWGTL